jgi:uncharacterized protein (TIGR03067 family)
MNATILITALVLGAPALKDKQKPESIVGEWIAEEITVGGKPTPVGGRELRWTFAADGTRSNCLAGQPALTGRYDDEPKKTLPSIDLEQDGANGANYHCAYKIEGDTLTLCVGWAKTPRPLTLESPEGSSTTLYVFRRVKR